MLLDENGVLTEDGRKFLKAVDRGILIGSKKALVEDEEGRCVIDKVKIEHLSLVPDENGNFVMPPYTHIVGPGDGAEIEICDVGAKNTDVEIWRKIPDDYYSPSIHVTEHGDIGINVGGHVLVTPVERWFAAGKVALKDELSARDELSDKALAKFEKLVEESESGVPSLATVDPNLIDYMEYPAHRDEWTDWLMGR